MSKWLLVAPLAVALGGGCFSRSGGVENETRVDLTFPETDIFDTPTKLWDACEKDNGAGAARFTEQYVEVTGKVRKVVPEKAMIVLETPSPTAGIVCLFPTMENVSKTNVGDVVRMQGLFKARPKPGTDIGLDDCKMWKPKQ
jgi:hypothetical protein